MGKPRGYGSWFTLLTEAAAAAADPAVRPQIRGCRRGLGTRK